MSFITDKQTLDDLRIFEKDGHASVYDLYNLTCTNGGAELLRDIFRNPMPDMKAINQRIETIRYFQSISAVFPYKAALLAAVDDYLQNTDERTRLGREDSGWWQKATRLVTGAATEQQTIYKGLVSLVELLQAMREHLRTIGASASVTPYRAEVDAMSQLLDEPGFQPLFLEKRGNKLPLDRAVEYDQMVRWRCRDKVLKLLYHIYKEDVYIAVARVAAERNFVFPVASSSDLATIRWEGVYHPLVANAKANSLEMTPEGNVLLLTGANMAGKSTLMKALGISVYVAHLGFPVAARKMEFTVRSGMFATINLPDDLGLGYSHFYAEVIRLRRIAEQLSAPGRLFVLFDELFRGTNVKDAYEATVAVSEAFATRRNSLFVVSTHIMEAGEALRERCANVFFRCLPTRMEGQRPVYTYQLEPGITDDRHGMIIIRNEGVLDLLEHGKMEKGS